MVNLSVTRRFMTDGFFHDLGEDFDIEKIR